MTQRKYQIPLTGEVTVDTEAGTVAVVVDLVDLPLDITYDYEVTYTEEQILADGDLIKDCQSGSLEHHTLTHRMSK